MTIFNDLHPDLLRMLIITTVAFLLAGGLGYLICSMLDKRLG